MPISPTLGAGSKEKPPPGTSSQAEPATRIRTPGSGPLSPPPRPGAPGRLPGGARVPRRAPRAGSEAPSRQLEQHFALTLAPAPGKLRGSAGARAGGGRPGLPGGGTGAPFPTAQKDGGASGGEEERLPGAAAPSPRPPQLLRMPGKLRRVPGLPAPPGAWPPGARSPAQPRAGRRAPAPPPPARAAGRQGLYFLRRARLDLTGPRQSCASARC